MRKVLKRNAGTSDTEVKKPKIPLINHKALTHVPMPV